MPGDVVGTAYVTIRAITAGIAKDIEDGVKKGAADADVEKSGRETGSKFVKGMGDSVEKDTSKTVSKHVEKSVSKTSGDSGVIKSSEKVGRSIVQHLLRGLGAEGSKKKGNVDKVFGDIARTAIAAFQFPKGAVDIVAVLGVPALGGAIQIATAALGSLTAALGQIVLASAGAGVALGGMFAALGVGLLPILLAFKSSGAAAEDFKSKMSELTKPFQEIGEAAINTLGPGLLTAVGNFKKFIPVMKGFGATQGEIVGNFASITSAVLTSSSNMAIWKEGLSEIPGVFKNLTPGFVGLANALPTIFTAAMPIAQQFSAALGGMGAKIGAFITKTGKTGLTAIFQGWYDKAAQVMRILGDLAQGLFNILKIGSERTGDTMFDKFERFAKKFDDWTKSVKGNNSIKGFFDRSSKIMHEVGLILGDMGKALFGPIKGAASSTSVVGTLESVRKKWIPPLKEIIEQIRKAGNLSFDNIIQEIGRFLDILAANPQVVTTVLSTMSINMGVFTAALKLLNNVLGSGVGKALFNFLGPLIPLVVLARKMQIGKLATDIIGLAKALDTKISKGAGVTGAVQGQFAGMGAEMDKTKGKFQPFQSAVGAMAAGVGGFMAGMAKDTGTAVAGMTVALAGIGAALARGDWIGAGVAAVTAGVGFIVGLWKKGQDEAKAKAAALVKQYKDIRDQVHDIFASSFKDAGTVAESERASIAFKTIRDAMDKGVDGAKTFSKAFGTSMDEVVLKMLGPKKEWEHFVVQTRKSEIIDVMHGNADATEVWGKAMKEAGGQANELIQNIQGVDLDMFKGQDFSSAVNVEMSNTIDTIKGLGNQLEEGKISWSDYATGAMAAGMTMKELKPIHDAYWDSLSNSMQASDSMDFIKTLRPELQKTAKEQLALIEVNKQLAIQQEKAKPPIQILGEAISNQRDKVKKLADEYINLVLQQETWAADMAGGALSVAESADTVFGNLADGQEGLGKTVKDDLKRTQEQAKAHAAYATSYTQEAQALVASGKGTYPQLQAWAEGFRQQQIQMRKEAGMPVDDAFMKWLDDITTVDTNAAFDMNIISSLNGAPESPEKIASDTAALTEILKINDKKEFNQKLLTHVMENGALSPAEQQALNQRILGDAIKANDKKKAEMIAHQKTLENNKWIAALPLSKDLLGLGGSVTGINGKKSATSAKHSTTENQRAKSALALGGDLFGLKGHVLGLNGTVGTAGANVNTKENGVQKGIPEMQTGISGLEQTIRNLDKLKASAEFELHATVFAEGQAAAILANVPLQNFKYGAAGGYFTRPTTMVIGEAGPEILLPISDQARSIQLLTKYAPELMGSKLDQIVLSPSRGSAKSTKTTGSVTGLNIEHATFQDGTDADLVAARIRSSLRSLGV